MNAEAVVQGDQSDSLIEPMEAVALYASLNNAQHPKSSHNTDTSYPG